MEGGTGEVAQLASAAVGAAGAQRWIIRFMTSDGEFGSQTSSGNGLAHSLPLKYDVKRPNTASLTRLASSRASCAVAWSTSGSAPGYRNSTPKGVNHSQDANASCKFGSAWPTSPRS